MVLLFHFYKEDHYKNKYLILNRPDNMQAYGTEGGECS